MKTRITKWRVPWLTFLSSYGPITYGDWVIKEMRRQRKAGRIPVLLHEGNKIAIGLEDWEYPYTWDTPPKIEWNDE